MKTSASQILQALQNNQRPARTADGRIQYAQGHVRGTLSMNLSSSRNTPLLTDGCAMTVFETIGVTLPHKATKQMPSAAKAIAY